MKVDKRHQYIKFYGRDWLGDTMLRMCTPAERGIWIDLLCVMMGGDPYGHLAINGRAMTEEEAAQVIGVAIDTFRGILAGLEEKGITSRNRSGLLFSRRLVREHDKFMVGSKSGKKGGGNPALKREDTDTRSHIPEAKGGLKVPYKGTFIGIKLPESLDSIGGFADEWQQFLENRRAKRAKATPRAQELLLKKLSEHPERAIEALQTAITRNWTGLEWEWLDGSGKQNKQVIQADKPISAWSMYELNTAIDAKKAALEAFPESANNPNHPKHGDWSELRAGFKRLKGERARRG